MNKNAIKKFAIDARNKLIASVTDKAGMLGITPDNCSEAITKGADFEVYKTAAGTEVTLNKKQCEQRRKLVDQIHARGFEAVVEEVAYTWFNRICAIRFMEVNDYMYPVRVRVLSSEKERKNEPDVVTMVPDIDWNFTDKEREEIIDAKMNNRLDDLFRMLFIKQCNLLHEVLPGLFEETEDYTEMLLNISFTNEDDVIRMLIDDKRGIPEEDFNVNTIREDGQPTGQVEIIGWLYQYYNTELKDDTFAKLKKNVKITKERIPAATQLFTPDWIVRYMVENSVGRIWIDHLRAVDPSIDEKTTAEKFGWKYYLPEAEQEEAVNVKLAEIRTTYKDLKPTDITCIDPCMGSGHILIAMFDVLMDIYESAGYDKRAYQLAYFAVMMKGRGYNRRFLRGRDGKPEPKVYAIVESNEINRNHLQFFGTHLSEMERNLATMQIEGLMNTFKDAREYGSILNVDACAWDVLVRFVDDLDTTGQISFESVGSDETQEQLKKLIRVAQNLGQKYDAVVTNPPYMGAAGMNSQLYNFVKDEYSDEKSDMSTVCMTKALTLCKEKGYMSMINIPVWMFIASYSKLRMKIINNNTIIQMLHLGRGIFGSDFGTTCFVIGKKYFDNYIGKYQRLFEKQGAVDSITTKRSWFLDGNNIFTSKQLSFTKIPGSPIAYWVSEQFINNFAGELVQNTHFSGGRNKTHGNEKYTRMWWEIANREKWQLYVKGGEFRRWYGNQEVVVDWSEQAKSEYASHGGLYNQDYVNKSGICWTLITSAKTAFRYKIPEAHYDSGSPTIFNKNFTLDLTLLGFLNSNIATEYLQLLNPTINMGNTYVLSLPYLNVGKYKEEIENLVKENIDNAKEDWDSFENSMQFMLHPFVKFKKENDKIENCFLIWKQYTDQNLKKMKQSECKLNEIFAKVYGLSNEINIQVPDKDISVRKANLKREIKSFVSYVVGCMFGRYSLDSEGLVYAGGEWDERKYLTYIPDWDNCIPITDEEYFTDDIVERFVEFVKTVYGADTLEENLDFIANTLGNKGDTSREVIRNYFLKDFYEDHLKVYQKRPIYWLFDSGKQNGFKALIYMHRYDADTVGRVRTDYLHKAQKYVETAMQSAQYTIDNATSASEKSKATKAVTKYTKQLAEMRIYDEAIAHVANQRIEIDLDDGVKVNYAKFQGVEVAQEGKKALKVDLLAKI